MSTATSAPRIQDSDRDIAKRPNDFAALTRAQWKGFWRDRQNWFWVLAFPLLFLFLFGFLLRDVGASKSEVALVGNVPFVQSLPAGAKTQFNELFETKDFPDRTAALEEVRKGDLDAAIEQRGNTVVVHYSAADRVVAANVNGSLSGFVQGMNQAVSGVQPRYSLQASQVEDESLKPIQFLAPGLLGWAVAMGATFGAAMPLVTWRTNKLLRRLRLAPVKTTSLVASRLVVAIAVAMIQTVLFLGLAVTVFGMKLSGYWWMSIPIIIAATLAFMAIGLIAGAVSKTAEAASGLANVIILPMAFLSGSFMPLDSAPGWMVTLSKFMPLGHLNQGILDVMVRGEGPAAAIQPILILLAFALVLGLIAAKLFRWED